MECLHVATSYDEQEREGRGADSSLALDCQTEPVQKGAACRSVSPLRWAVALFLKRPSHFGCRIPNMTKTRWCLRSAYMRCLWRAYVGAFPLGICRYLFAMRFPQNPSNRCFFCDMVVFSVECALGPWIVEGCGEARVVHSVVGGCASVNTC